MNYLNFASYIGDLPTSRPTPPTTRWTIRPSRNLKLSKLVIGVTLKSDRKFESGVCFCEKKAGSDFVKIFCVRSEVTSSSIDWTSQVKKRHRVKRGEATTLQQLRPGRSEWSEPLSTKKSRPEVRVRAHPARQAGRGRHQCTATPPQSSGEFFTSF